MNSSNLLNDLLVRLPTINPTAYKIEKARRHLVDYLEYVNGGTWKRAPHLELLCKKLEEVERGELLRLMVFMPPRHGKSEVISRGFPAWYLGRNPRNEIIMSSYSRELATDFSRKARSLVADYGKELFGIGLSYQSAAVGKWMLENDVGALAAVGAGGTITGRGAHCAIIDDPIKDWDSARSKALRDSIYDWYRSVLYTRLSPKGAIVLVQTRWHEDDLAGRLIADMKAGIGDRWEIIEFPALAYSDDALGRKSDDPLWPERFPKEKLLQIRDTLGPVMWSALYQQRPSPASGAVFKRSQFQYYTRQGDDILRLHATNGDKLVPLSSAWIFQTIDPAATENEHSDYFAAATWAVTQDSELVLLDMFREHASTVKHMQIVDALYERWRPKFQAVENKTFGLNIIQELKRRGRPIVPLKAENDKYTRSLPLQARYEIGAVYHPERAPWLEDFENELIMFPNGEHDDMVDTASYAAIVLSSKANRAARVSSVDLAAEGF